MAACLIYCGGMPDQRQRAKINPDMSVQGLADSPNAFVLAGTAAKVRFVCLATSAASLLPIATFAPLFFARVFLSVTTASVTVFSAS